MSKFKKSTNQLAPSNNKRWTKKDDVELRQLVEEGATASEAAIILGRTKTSVSVRKNYLGVTKRLASSKGKDVKAPVTLRKNGPLKNPRTQSTKVVKVKTRPNLNVIDEALDFRTVSKTLSSLAKATGAKIVITFE